MYAHLKALRAINKWPFELMTLNKVQGLFGTLKILSTRHNGTYKFTKSPFYLL